MSKEKTRSKHLPLFITAGILACSAVIALVFMSGDSSAEQLPEGQPEQTTEEVYEQTVVFFDNISSDKSNETDNEEYSVSDVFIEEDFESIDFVGGVCCDNTSDDDVIDDDII